MLNPTQKKLILQCSRMGLIGTPQEMIQMGLLMRRERRQIAQKMDDMHKKISEEIEPIRQKIRETEWRIETIFS